MYSSFIAAICLQLRQHDNQGDKCVRWRNKPGLWGGGESGCLVTRGNIGQPSRVLIGRIHSHPLDKVYAEQVDSLHMEASNIFNTSARESGGAVRNSFKVFKFNYAQSEAMSGAFQVFASSVALLWINNSNMIGSSSTHGNGGCLSASVGQCDAVSNSQLSGCSSLSGYGGAAWMGLGSGITAPLSASALLSAAATASSNGCPDVLLQAMLYEISSSGSNALRALSSPSSLLLMSSVMIEGSSGSSGGALTVQLGQGSSAVLDSMNLSGNTATTSDGGALAVSVTKQDSG